MDYANYFQMAGLEVPVGSRNVPQVFLGTQCPNSVRFGRVHGTSPATGSIEFDDTVSYSLGTVTTLTIGGATFVGMVVKGVVKVNDNDGQVTDISMVDMRDRLHDKNVFGAFNMLDEHGRYYHIIPRDWSTQNRRFIFSVDRAEFAAPKTGSLANVTSCGYKTVSVTQIIEALSGDFGFTWSADSTARNIMDTTKPDNIDWNNGIKCIDGISQVLSHCALQMTFWGNLHMHVTLRGISENTFINQLVSGGATQICRIPNALDGSLGTELNERGRRVLIVGSRNKRELRFKAIPDWNQKWTWRMVFNTMNLDGLLSQNTCTLNSRLEELPQAYREPDDALWNGQPRNKMRIGEYLQQIPYKVYIIDFSQPVKDDDGAAMPGLNGKYGGTNANTKKFSRYPLSDKLVSHTDVRFQAICSMRTHHYKGTFESFDVDPKKRVVSSDAQLDVEEFVSKDDCQVTYKARVIYGTPRFAADKQTNDGNSSSPSDEPGNITLLIKPENVVVRVSLDTEFYTWVQGELGTGARTREFRKTVSALHKGFVDEAEVPILSQTFADQGLSYNVKADDIAPLLAQKLLFHEAINRAGHIRFDDTAGYMADGIVDSVNTAFSPSSGVEEVLNLTTGILDFDNLPIVRQGEFGTKSKSFFKDEKELSDDLIAAQGAAILKAANEAKFGANFVNNQGRVGGIINNAGFCAAFGSSGHVSVKVPKAVHKVKSLKRHQPVVVKKPSKSAPKGRG